MRNIISYFVMGFFIFMYTYTFKESAAIVFFFSYIIAPFLSIVLILLTYKKISFSFDMPHGETEKEEYLTVTVNITNKSFLPVPIIKILFINSPHFINLSPLKVAISLKPHQTKSITLKYMSKLRGKAYLGVEKIILGDYLGFLKLSLVKNIEINTYKKSILVLPRLFLNDDNYFIKSKSLVQAGDSPSGRYSYTVEPGFEFREFIAGDSLNKIHWKLSAKKDKLYVRKDQYLANVRECFVLNPCLPVSKRIQNNTEKALLIMEENILETVLANAWSAVKQGREIEVWLFEKEKWNTYLVEDKHGILELQRRFGDYEFIHPRDVNEQEQMPLSLMLGNHSKEHDINRREFLIFTGYENKIISETISTCKQKKIAVDMILVEDNR